MALSSDLQDMVADVSAAIAGAKTLGRTELEIWRRRLTAAAEESRTAEASMMVHRAAVDRVCRGIDQGVLDLAGLARVARGQVEVAS